MRIPRPSCSRAATRVNPTTVCFEAVYGPSPRTPVSPLRDGLLTISPPPGVHLPRPVLHATPGDADAGRHEAVEIVAAGVRGLGDRDADAGLLTAVPGQP